MNEIIRLLDQFFKSDENKIELWLNTRNPMLADYKPIELILAGRERRVLQFIQNAKFENGW